MVDFSSIAVRNHVVFNCYQCIPPSVYLNCILAQNHLSDMVLKYILSTNWPFSLASKFETISMIS